MTWWSVLFTILIFVFFFERWRTEKKMFILLQTIARNLGIDELNHAKDLHSKLLHICVTLNGRWSGIKVILQISSISEGIGTLLELDSASPIRLRIRRPRKFYNIDVMELFTRSAPKVKFKTSENEDFEIFADDPSSLIQILNRSGIIQRLQRCIESQNDLLEINEKRILIKASSRKFFETIAWKEIEEKLFQMWFLATSISSLLPPNTKIDINLLRCPYCRGMLNDGVKIVRCNSCYTMFHENCWIENGQCGIFRCYGSTSEAIEVKVNNHVL